MKGLSPDIKQNLNWYDHHERMCDYYEANYDIGGDYLLTPKREKIMETYPVMTNGYQKIQAHINYLQNRMNEHIDASAKDKNGRGNFDYK